MTAKEKQNPHRKPQGHMFMGMSPQSFVKTSSKKYVTSWPNEVLPVSKIWSDVFSPFF